MDGVYGTGYECLCVCVFWGILSVPCVHVLDLLILPEQNGGGGGGGGVYWNHCLSLC